MKNTNLIHVETLINEDIDLIYIDGVRVAKRPVGFSNLKFRLKCIWLVFTGKADILIWYKQ